LSASSILVVFISSFFSFFSFLSLVIVMVADSSLRTLTLFFLGLLTFLFRARPSSLLTIFSSFLYFFF
jgi:hypothetical protein